MPAMKAFANSLIASGSVGLPSTIYHLQAALKMGQKPRVLWICFATRLKSPKQSSIWTAISSGVGLWRAKSPSTSEWRPPITSRSTTTTPTTPSTRNTSPIPCKTSGTGAPNSDHSDIIFRKLLGWSWCGRRLMSTQLMRDGKRLLVSVDIYKLFKWNINSIII